MTELQRLVNAANEKARSGKFWFFTQEQIADNCIQGYQPECAMPDATVDAMNQPQGWPKLPSDSDNPEATKPIKFREFL